MSNLILLIILWSFLECAYKKIPIYEEFITGERRNALFNDSFSFFNASSFMGQSFFK